MSDRTSNERLTRYGFTFRDCGMSSSCDFEAKQDGEYVRFSDVTGEMSRMRKALAQIARAVHCRDPYCAECKEIARRALNGEPT